VTAGQLARQRAYYAVDPALGRQPFDAEIGNAHAAA
jgi:hypothetical protein